MLYSLLLLLSFFIQIEITRGSDASNYFINPSSGNDINPVWTLGEEQVISWATTLGTFNISMWQESLVEESAASQGNIYSKIHSTDQVTNFTWVVQLYGFTLDYSNVFFLWINSDDPDGFVSCYFNITEPTTTTTTTTTSKTDATASSTSTKLLELASPSATSTITNAAATQSATTTSTSSSSSGGRSSGGMIALTTTGQIALGVGIGIGVPVIAALAALVWLKARANNRVTSMAADSQDKLPLSWSAPPPQQLPTKPKEMPGTNPIEFYPELPGQLHR
ncbi:hypothetical protein BO70DRAFT_430175 [Aspergillus heteromorphus CBS 117.55]|uniref:Mid2 domain-containing protein n=1 Tax=Aspergillus heteromorphus CBS 117.55 TaxID=1448321 RepID=A0A317VXB1_9EURO|nr:uncharacterized protein BO70DRAFT_430175 [Aspergillus heteromorphus CBS 117.55]PWY78259.1 hypothetical protein BO70DRAFT_430175 [Aspergillus heteromorphus CBS 117.55]